MLSCLAILVFAVSKTFGESSAVHAGGLSCFSIISPAARATLPPERQAKARQGWVAQSSCDAMCAAQGGACVATGGSSGVDECATVPPDAANFAACRCCAAAK
jgi:hypothetical protein